MDNTIMLELFKFSPIVAVLCFAVWVLWGRYTKEVEKKDKENRDWTMNRIDELKGNINELKAENKEDKKMFQTAINSFNESVKEFKSVNSEISKVNIKMESMQKDIIEIKGKVN